jgi:preprotein translocase subunit YajC
MDKSYKGGESMKSTKRVKILLLALTILLTVALLAAPAALAGNGEAPADPNADPNARPQASCADLGGSLFMFVPLIAVFYFLIIRPESKRKKAAAKLRSELIVTDEVTTMGGIVGKVVQIKDDLVTIETSAERTRLTILRGAISSKETKISE